MGLRRRPIRNWAGGLSGVCLALPLLWAGPAHADYRVEWHADATLQERFDDNLNLAPSDPVWDLITTVSPGGDLLVESRTGRLLLEYYLDANFYARNPVLDYLGHRANLDLTQSLSRHVKFQLRETFTKSDSPREAAVPAEAPAPGDVRPTEFLIGTRLERRQYMRNNINPTLTWEYGSDDSLRLGYRNELFREDDTPASDKRDTATITWTHWFGPQYGVLLNVDYLKTHFWSSSDYDGQDGLATFTHKLNPHTAVFVQGGVSNRTYKDETPNYQVYKGSLGVEHAFNQAITGRLRAGYYYQVPEEGKADAKPEGEASVTARWRRLTGTAFVKTGYTESALDSENLGFTQYASAGMAFRYQVFQYVALFCDGSYNRYDLPTTGIEDRWQVRTGMEARLFRWLTGSLDFFHQESLTETTSNYRNNQITFRLTARY